jgi:uncharacterized protein
MCATAHRSDASTNSPPTRRRPRLAFRLTPHDRGFYPLFTRAAENIVSAVAELSALVTADPLARPDHAARVKAAELDGDDLTHEIMVKLNSTFVTPFDREDIYRLASSLDDVVDALEEAADRIVLYRLGELPVGMGRQVEVLGRAAESTAAAMPRLADVSNLRDYWVEVNSLENEGDQIHREMLANLLPSGAEVTAAEVLHTLQVKEVIETLEEAIDTFETVANVVESIAVKES